MADFAPKITTAGAALLARVEAAEVTLDLTRMALGDGALPGGETEQQQTDLINEVLTENLVSLVAADATVTARADFSNAALVADLEARELGLFADDPDNPGSEILVIYANAGDGYDFLPAAGGGDLTTLVQKILIAITNTAQVTLLVDEGAAYITQDVWQATIPLLMPTGAVLPFAMPTAPAGWLECNGAAVSRETYANLLAAMTATHEVTFQNQGGFLRMNWTGGVPGMTATTSDVMAVTFEAGAGGTLPTGIVAGTEYLIEYGGVGFYMVSDAGGTPIAYSDAGSGALTGRSYPFGIGDGATTFNLPELRSEFIRGWAHGRTAGENAARAFGTWQPATLIPVDTTMGASDNDTMGIGPDGATIQGDAYDAADYPGAKYNNVVGEEPGPAGTVVGNLSDTPANATAVHPRNVALMYCIKY